MQVTFFHSGWVWAKHKFSHKHWMVDITMRISGRLKNGADGMVRPFVMFHDFCMSSLLSPSSNTGHLVHRAGRIRGLSLWQH